MKIASLACSVAVVAILLASGTAPAVSSEPAAIISTGATADLLDVKDIRVRDGIVSGVLINKSGRAVRNVQLLIRHTWFWNDERHPGDDNPGRADYFTVADEIPPAGMAPFTFRSDPLPHRSDGRFGTAAEVVGFTQIGE